MKFMFESFEEYAMIMGLNPQNCNWEAYKILWNMARTPELNFEDKPLKKKKAKK